MELSNNSSKVKLIASEVIHFIFIILMMVYIFDPVVNLLDFDVILSEIPIEKIDFVDSEIQDTVRNTGHVFVDISMADVNYRIQPAAVEPDRFLERFETMLIQIPLEWNEAKL